MQVITKSLAGITLMAGLVAGLIAGQAMAGPKYDIEKKVAKMVKRLDLEESQVEPVKTILREQHAKKVELRKQMKESMRPQMQAIKQETGDRLSAVLTPEQQKKFAEMREKHQAKKERYKERRAERDD